MSLILRSVLLALILATVSVICDRSFAAGPVVCLDKRVASDKATTECAKPGSNLSIAETEALVEAARLVALKKADERAKAKHLNDLLRRFPSEEELAHQREAALRKDRANEPTIEKRETQLRVARQKLDDDAYFYTNVGNAIPPKLKREIDQSDASFAAQQQAQEDINQKVANTNTYFDEQASLLKPLWPTFDAAIGATTSKVSRK